MEYRYLDIKDYDTLLKWWKDNRFPPPSLDDLPMVNGYLEGIIVSEKGIDLCAGFIIDTTVKNGCMFEYPVANFDIKDRVLRKKAMQFLLKSVSDICREMNKKYIFISLKHPNLKKSLLDNGFITTSSGTTEMIKAL